MKFDCNCRGCEQLKSDMSDIVVLLGLIVVAGIIFAAVGYLFGR